MKRRFSHFSLLAVVSLAAVVFSVVDARRRLKAINDENALLRDENALLRFDAAVSRHEELYRLLATESRYDRPSGINWTAQLNDKQKVAAISMVEKEIAELEQGLKTFNRISQNEYEQAIEAIKNLDFERQGDRVRVERNRVRDYDARKIVSFIVENPHIDPRIIKMEPWVEGSVKIYTGNVADGWGFVYVARKDSRGSWIVRYHKGCAY